MNEVVQEHSPEQHTRLRSAMSDTILSCLKTCSPMEAPEPWRETVIADVGEPRIEGFHQKLQIITLSGERFSEP